MKNGQNQGMKRSQTQMPMHMRVMSVRSESVREEDHTFEAVLTTQDPVRRYDWWNREYYDEVLSITEDAINAKRMDQGMPLLDNHRAWGGISGIKGRTGDWWIDGDKLVSRVRVDVGNEEGADLWRRITEGFVKDISIGYVITEAKRDRKDPEDGERRGKLTVTATKWEIYEASLVTIPADARASVRSGEQREGSRSDEPYNGAPLYPCTILSRDGAETDMKTKKNKPAAEPTPAETAPEAARAAETPEQPAAAPEPAAEPNAEDTRASEQPEAADASYVLERCDQNGLTLEFARGLIDENLSREQALERIMDELQSTRGGHVSTATTPNAEQERDQRLDAMADSVLARAGQMEYSDISEQARQFAGYDLVELARQFLGRDGFGLSRDNVLELALRAPGMHSTSDFALMLADVANKQLRKAFQETAQTWKPFCSRSSANDFKTIRRLQTGDHPSLQKVNEHGEFKSGTFSESQETYSLATYGVILGFTRQMMINDDLSSWLRVVRGSGIAAARLEADTIWDLVKNNGAMADGDALFHANHGNLGTGGAVNETTLTEARKLMRKQKTVDNHHMNVVGKYIAVPTDREVEAQKQLTAIVADQTGNVNVFNGKYQIIVEPRLDGVTNNPWYVFADPSAIDFIEYAYLNGNSTPFTATRAGWEVDGLEYKVRHDFGAGVLDYRGALKNPGA